MSSNAPPAISPPGSGGSLIERVVGERRTPSLLYASCARPPPGLRGDASRERPGGAELERGSSSSPSVMRKPFSKGASSEPYWSKFH